MEAHHPHHVTHKKKWTGYLLEFFMLFLAVFLGFTAENIREHAVEKKRERQYIKSFYEDLTSDEKSLPQLANFMKISLTAADSLQLLLPHADTKKPANLTYVYLRSIIRQLGITLFINDRTIVQLRNSGGMRLIQNKQVSDSIVAYYKTVDRIQWFYDNLLWIKRSLRETVAPILNGTDYGNVVDSTDKVINPTENIFLRSTDDNAINNCLLSISDIKGLGSSIRQSVIRLKIRAGNIKKFIAKEYHLE